MELKTPVTLAYPLTVDEAHATPGGAVKAGEVLLTVRAADGRRVGLKARGDGVLDGSLPPEGMLIEAPIVFARLIATTPTPAGSPAGVVLGWVLTLPLGFILGYAAGLLALMLGRWLPGANLWLWGLACGVAAVAGFVLTARLVDRLGRGAPRGDGVAMLGALLALSVTLAMGPLEGHLHDLTGGLIGTAPTAEP